MYEYMTLPDDTGIAHSEMKPDGMVKVYFENPVPGGFIHFSSSVSITCFTQSRSFGFRAR